MTGRDESYCRKKHGIRGGMLTIPYLFNNHHIVASTF
jgi:hypothetical protein